MRFCLHMCINIMRSLPNITITYKVVLDKVHLVTLLQVPLQNQFPYV